MLKIGKYARKIFTILRQISVLYFTVFISSCCFAQKSSNPLSLLHQNISDVTIKDDVYKQTFQGKNGSCIVSFKILNSKNQNEDEYECNLSDLNEYKIELNVSKQRLKIKSKTKSRDVVSVYENGKIKNYTDKCEFYAKVVAHSKMTEHEQTRKPPSFYFANSKLTGKMKILKNMEPKTIQTGYYRKTLRVGFN